MQLDVQTEARAITSSDLVDLLQPHEGPCVSIYVAAQPAQGADQGRIRFKTAIREAEKSLRERSEPGQRDNFLDPLREIADSDLWLSMTPGLAAFLSGQALHVRRLPEPLPDVTIVADSFHVRPLIRAVQGAGRFQILAVSNERVALYEGDRHHLEEVPLHPDVPRDMGEALGQPRRVTNPKTAPWEPDDSDTRDRQLQRYFRRIDGPVWEHHSRDAGLPLILAALPEYQTFFREASHNQNLVSDAAIRRDPFKGVQIDDLRQMAVEAMQPVWERQMRDLRERFGNARSQQKGSDDLHDIGRNAAFGKVATLMIQQARRVGGTLDPGTGEITFKPINDPGVDDVIDDIAETVLRNGGETMILPPELMPTDSGVAAIYRY